MGHLNDFRLFDLFYHIAMHGIWLSAGTKILAAHVFNYNYYTQSECYCKSL